MLGLGLGLAEIAAETGPSYKTIANACALMKGKLGARMPAELVRAAPTPHLRSPRSGRLEGYTRFGS